MGIIRSFCVFYNLYTLFNIFFYAMIKRFKTVVLAECPIIFCLRNLSAPSNDLENFHVLCIVVAHNPIIT